MVTQGSREAARSRKLFLCPLPHPQRNLRLGSINPMSSPMYYAVHSLSVTSFGRSLPLKTGRLSRYLNVEIAVCCSQTRRSCSLNSFVLVSSVSCGIGRRRLVRQWIQKIYFAYMQSQKFPTVSEQTTAVAAGKFVFFFLFTSGVMIVPNTWAWCLGRRTRHPDQVFPQTLQCIVARPSAKESFQEVRVFG
jgi:hypothetical protein